MTIAKRTTLRRWAWRSLLIASLFAAPAAYSEVVSDNPPEDEGTLLGNYLSGRLARGDHDTQAAADFYSTALSEDPGNEIILYQALLIETASSHWYLAI